MTTFKTPDGQTLEEYTKFPRQSTPCGVIWVSLLVNGNRVRKYDLSQLVEVVDPRLTGMVYGCEEPTIVYTCEPPPLTLVERDYLDSLTEILNSRNPDRQAERDLYLLELYDAIADEVDAAA